MYFVIYKSSNSQYYFTIKSDNQEIVATSETYLTKWSAEKTINSIKNGINSDSLIIDMTK
ncbi:YegP family protein [Weissella paramesenteroides]|uniref:YegP family protein n=1 Tax=Weissella paramesenteroides TaxID=1249 RepID=UPI00207363AA|nr:DUF1508 domain-containing protein [Weissella paramesenteroides]MCM6765917.1 DUF1508 domain-containing protein [Weissella paramesenteroides]MCM6767292.1 DUF1508 domain-containing protein [Weissella paramesenteroides]MCM6771627.1 DUF1508 domain-containing protein [Weissella paramesenteroides]MCM6779280.1 DUF1508 domain-containing protein [Weissella paramesenteroides]MCM6781498.1 DUF1508 domain-containing protein [Weissella paramesenteroides]